MLQCGGARGGFESTFVVSRMLQLPGNRGAKDRNPTPSKCEAECLAMKRFGVSTWRPLQSLQHSALSAQRSALRSAPPLTRFILGIVFLSHLQIYLMEDAKCVRKPRLTTTGNAYTRTYLHPISGLHQCGAFSNNSTSDNLPISGFHALPIIHSCHVRFPFLPIIT